MRELKPHMSPQQLVALMQRRGLIIADPAAAQATLRRINYYRLSGYLNDFKRPGAELYEPGLSWERLLRIYDFDRRLTRILMFALEDIEETLKTRLSFVLTTAHKNDPEVYLRREIYKDDAAYQRFLSDLSRKIKNNRKLPFVKHHIEQYGGHFPLWVAVELFTMGNLNALYGNLKRKYQKELASLYGTGPIQLHSWVENLTYTRNHLAHYMRIYGYRFGRTPAKCRKCMRCHEASHMIFDQVFTISCMYSSPKEWNGYILKEIGQLLEGFAPDVSPSGLGFPADWPSLLSACSRP